MSLKLLWVLQMQGLAEMENSGFIPLLQHDKYKDLARMFTLFRRIERGLDFMRGMMGNYLKETGRALVLDPERTKDPVDFVQTLLAEKAKYDRSGPPLAACDGHNSGKDLSGCGSRAAVS